MKRGYRNLLIFEILIIILLFLNNFVSSILSGYLKVLFIVLLIVAFKFIFGFEKDRHHLWKMILVEVLIFLLGYFILYYVFGIVISFTRIRNYLNFNGIFNVIIPLILTIISKEFLRYNMLKKSEGSRSLIILTTSVFIMIDLIGGFDRATFLKPVSIFMFLSLWLLPIISKNILCSYISYKVGYKPVLVYLLVMELYPYIIPIIPNPNEYIYSIINLIIPFVLLYRLYKLFKKDMDEDIVREYHKKHFLALILPCMISIFMVYITSGYFHYHAIVIASGSMEPEIYKGDVVVIEKIGDNYDLLDLNQVIAYRYNDIIVVHRLVKVINVDGEKFYYTKGDANNDIDNYQITKDMIIGIVNVKVPYIGLPTVWLKNL